jgi:hypothetical protein
MKFVEENLVVQIRLYNIWSMKYYVLYSLWKDPQYFPNNPSNMYRIISITWPSENLKYRKINNLFSTDFSVLSAAKNFKIRKVLFCLIFYNISPSSFAMLLNLGCDIDICRNDIFFTSNCFKILSKDKGSKGQWLFCSLHWDRRRTCDINVWIYSSISEQHFS